jgi:hypothetical protein
VTACCSYNQSDTYIEHWQTSRDGRYESIEDWRQMCSTMRSYEKSSKGGVVFGVLGVLRNIKNLEAYGRNTCLQQRILCHWNNWTSLRSQASCEPWPSWTSYGKVFRMQSVISDLFSMIVSVMEPPSQCHAATACSDCFPAFPRTMQWPRVLRD